MSYFRYIDNGDGPTKLFVGGIHGNEWKTSIKFLKKLKKSYFSNGQIYIYNFDKSQYISTINKKYYESEIGLKVLDLIKTLKPDFYTELHCYNIKNFDKLTSIDRINQTGVPPLIDLGNYVLVSSVSPLIRIDYFDMFDVCKTLEFPCLDKLTPAIKEKYGFDEKKAIDTYMDMLKLIAIAPTRKYFEEKIYEDYTKQANLAIKFAKFIFGEGFPPY